MKTIGFKNFRRFENLEPLQLGGVNFFVGGNNSGKSTVVKAMMLLLDNLIFMRPKQQGMMFDNVPSFYLGVNHIHNLHIGTFARALHKPFPELKEMSFEAELAGYKFVLTVTGDVDSTSAGADVRRIEVVNLMNDVRYIFDFDDNSFVAQFNTEVLNGYLVAKEQDFWQNIRFGSSQHHILSRHSERRVAMIERRLEQLMQSLSLETNPVEIARINSSIKSETRRLKDLKNAEKPFITKKEDREYKSTIVVENGVRSVTYLGALLDGQWMYYMNIKEGIEQNSLFGKNEEEQNDRFAQQYRVEQFYNDLSLEEKAMLCMFADDARQLRGIGRSKIEYMAAHTASQKMLFSIEDRNDYMSQVIREFVAERIVEGTELSNFLYDWMYKHFEIAMGYDIKPIHGEAYTMEITCMNGEKMPLADLGMGAVQIIMMLLRLATVISRAGNLAIRRTTFIVEEPEQNLHPKLQSKLADLFAFVNEKYGCQFVIETHSEYLIRRTQAMIATGEVSFEQNPFKVYYFPQDGQPYDMEYQESGLFNKKFGDGFFDESSRQHLAVIKKARELQ